MRILFVNAYFTPETIAFSHLERDLIEGLVDAGHEIEVICPTPTRGVSDEIHREYRSVRTERLYGGKVHVRRFFAPREGRNPLIRALRYFWCNFREYQLGRKYRDIDAVFAVSTPPTQGILAGRLSKKLNCPFIYSVQDIFPDSLVITGLAEEGSLPWKIGRWMERRTYRYAASIIVISESCKRNLMQKGVAGEKLSLISNWVDTERVKPVAREDNKLISEFRIDPNKFLAVYAGNFGAAQGADIILKAAAKLLDEPEIQFVIFGGGAEFSAAAAYAEKHHLTNVTVHPLLAQDRVSEVYSLGDIALITCKPGAGSSGMPSKLWSIMACNTPVLASFDTKSDLAEILGASGAGVCTEAGNADALARAVVQAYRSRGQLKNRGLREYVKQYADKRVCVSRYLEIMNVNQGKE